MLSVYLSCKVITYCKLGLMVSQKMSQCDQIYSNHVWYHKYLQWLLPNDITDNVINQLIQWNWFTLTSPKFFPCTLCMFKFNCWLLSVCYCYQFISVPKLSHVSAYCLSNVISYVISFPKIITLSDFLLDFKTIFYLF